MVTEDTLPIMSFKTRQELRKWLISNYKTSKGIFVRISKKNLGIPSVSFEDILDEGLCFGWSESMRLRGDKHSYLQKFTLRKTKGTTSARNKLHVEKLIQEGRMTSVGLKALGIQE